MTLTHNRLPTTQQAFSLVEVALALGIVSFAFVTILALLPLGLSTNRDSLEESRATNVLQTIVADRRAAPSSTVSPVYALPAFTPAPASASPTPTPSPTPYPTMWIAEDGSSSPTVTAQSLYRVNYTIYPSPGFNQPALFYFTIMWPANAPAASISSKVEAVATFLP